MTAFIFFIGFIMWVVLYAILVSLAETIFHINNDRTLLFMNIFLFVFSICATIDIIRIFFM